MENAPDHAELWSQTTKTVRNDLNIPMEVIAIQSNRIARDWLDGFTDMMFEGVERDKKTGRIDFSKSLKARTIKIENNGAVSGASSRKSLTVPLLSVAQYPAMAMDNLEFKLSYTVTTKDEETEHSTTDSSFDQTLGVGASGSFGVVDWSASLSTTVHFGATSDSNRRRDTDSRATLDVIAKYTRVPPAEGMERLTAALLESALPTQPA